MIQSNLLTATAVSNTCSLIPFSTTLWCCLPLNSSRLNFVSISHIEQCHTKCPQAVGIMCLHSQRYSGSGILALKEEISILCRVIGSQNDREHNSNFSAPSILERFSSAPTGIDNPDNSRYCSMVSR